MKDTLAYALHCAKPCPQDDPAIDVAEQERHDR